MIQNDETENTAASGDPVQGGHEAEPEPVEYIKLVRAYLRSGKNNEAFSIIQKAAVHFPEEPLIISYYGYLQTAVDKKYRSGVETCKQAITLMTVSAAVGKDALYPTLYLNLGRAYVAAEKRKEAVEAFRKGLKYDRRNGDIIHELKKLGERKGPPIPFLDRSNPINMLIGMLLYKVKK